MKKTLVTAVCALFSTMTNAETIPSPTGDRYGERVDALNKELAAAEVTKRYWKDVTNRNINLADDAQAQHDAVEKLKGELAGELMIDAGRTLLSVVSSSKTKAGTTAQAIQAAESLLNEVQKPNLHNTMDIAEKMVALRTTLLKVVTSDPDAARALENGGTIIKTHLAILGAITDVMTTPASERPAAIAHAVFQIAKEIPAGKVVAVGGELTGTIIRAVYSNELINQVLRDVDDAEKGAEANALNADLRLSGASTRVEELKQEVRATYNMQTLRYVTAKTPDQKVGGVLLAGTLTTLGAISEIKAATLAPGGHELILIGPQRATPWTLPVHPGYFLAALKAAAEGENPAISIDPAGTPCRTRPAYRDTNTENANSVCYFGHTSGTYLGLVMFEADRLLKTLSFRQDNITRYPLDPVPDELPSLDDDVTGMGPLPDVVNSRFWISRDKITLEESTDHRGVTFVNTTMRVNSETMATGVPHIIEHFYKERDTAFAKYVTDHYDDLALRWPALEDLRQAAQTVAVVNWLRGHAFIDNDLIAHTPTLVSTPDTTPELNLVHTYHHEPFDFRDRVSGGVDLSMPDAAVLVTHHDTDALLAAAISARPLDKGNMVLALGTLLLLALAFMVITAHTPFPMPLRIMASLIISTGAMAWFMKNHLPLETAVAWTFTNPADHTPYAATALPLGITELPHLVPESSLPDEPMMRSKIEATLDATNQTTTPIYFENTTGVPASLAINGVSLSEVKENEKISLNLPLGSYTIQFGDKEDTFKVTRRSATLQLREGISMPSAVPDAPELSEDALGRLHLLPRYNFLPLHFDMKNLKPKKR